MSPPSDDDSEATSSPPTDLPEAVTNHLAQMNDSELRSVISYARSLLSPTPTVRDLLEEGPGENIREVEEQDGYTKVVKAQSCAEGCENCPHGPYLYHVQVEPALDSEEGPSLHWQFLGRVT